MSRTETVSAIVDAEKEAAKFIFGLAVAIGTVSLITRVPAKPFGMVVDIAEFGFSFLFLVSVWLAYWNIMSDACLMSNGYVLVNHCLTMGRVI